VIFDGGLTHALQKLGFVPPVPLGSGAALREMPESLSAVHRAYVAAGVHVIRANTARTTPRVLRKVGYEYRAAALTNRAVDLAFETVQEVPGSVAVAGVMFPLEGREDPDETPPDGVLHEEHGAQAQRLFAAGCDALYLESMPTMREAVAATAAAVRVGLPTFTSFAVGSDLRLISGDDLSLAARAVRAAGADVVCVNGGASLGEAERAAGVIEQAGVPWGCLPDLPARVRPEKFVALAVKLAARGVSVFGGCCGLAPEDLAAVVDALSPRFEGRDSIF
jgi:S-methylmethionine-dependent homocysteine/selenocysteine methylase